MTTPEHYKHGIEPIEVMKKNMSKEQYIGFLRGNVIKYILRYDHKDGEKDIVKAIDYAERLLNAVREGKEIPNPSSSSSANNKDNVYPIREEWNITSTS